METAFIISQIFIVICYATFAVSYFVKNRTTLLILNSCSLVAEGISYFLLDAWSGVAMVVVASIRNGLFFLQMKFTKLFPKIQKYDWIWLAIVLVLAVIFAIITFETIFSVLPIIASMIYTYSIWQKNNLTYKLLGIPCSLILIVYNIFIGSTFGYILESVLLCWIIISIFRKDTHSVSQEQEKISSI